jgi:AAA15 family ATPase/GTPase
LKLIEFSVTNFRSITSAHKIPISGTTILIGRNNEGKSNILKALSISMNILQRHAMEERRGYLLLRRPYRKDESQYYWERDFPIALQNRKSANQSIFKLEFELDQSEIAEFKNQIKSNLNGTLPLLIKIGKDDKPTIKVNKRGRGSKTLNAKSAKISEFIARRIFFNHIPAVRTDREALSVIEEMLSRELRVLERDTKYIEALGTIRELQKPILRNLAQRIKEPLSEFLPNINSVRIDIPEKLRRVAPMRDFEVVIDDGTPTSIELKGDGVKSLAALGLLKNKSIKSGISVIAIEEPESHLHPEAIHQINEVVCSLVDENQVIITTHNPLFVDRDNIKSNIIIDRGKVTPAKGVREIRDLLGIKASDNLINANYALIVEGDDDKLSLTSLLKYLSEKAGRALKNRLFVIEPIGGAGNLSYKLSLMKTALCKYHVLLDNDDAGRQSFQKANNEKLLSVQDCTLVNCRGMVNSEFEDSIDPTLYKDAVLSEFGVNLNSTKFRGGEKWSDRMKSVFMDQGKPWNKQIRQHVKNVVANCIAENPKNALHANKRNSIDSLVNALELMIKG